MALLTSLLGLFGAALALPGCARTPKTPAAPITEVQQISFSKQGMARTAITNRTIRRTDQGAEIVLELWDGEEPDSVYPADASILQEARELLDLRCRQLERFQRQQPCGAGWRKLRFLR